MEIMVDLYAKDHGPLADQEDLLSTLLLQACNEVKTISMPLITIFKFYPLARQNTSTCDVCVRFGFSDTKTKRRSRRYNHGIFPQFTFFRPPPALPLCLNLQNKSPPSSPSHQQQQWIMTITTTIREQNSRALFRAKNVVRAIHSVTRRRLSPGETLFQQGAIGRALFTVEEGELDVVKEHGGVSRTVARLSPGKRARRRGGILMKMHAVVSRSLTSYPYNAGTEHVQLSSARLYFTKGNTSHYSVMIPTLSCQMDSAMGFEASRLLTNVARSGGVIVSPRTAWVFNPGACV